MIPDFDENGNLPPGFYKVTPEEIFDRFCKPQFRARNQRGEKLRYLLDEIQNYAKRIYIDGSFVTEKLAPSDVDVIIVLPDGFDYESHAGDRLHMIHSNKGNNHLDIFFYKEKFQEDKIQEMIEYYTNDKDENPKGIIFVEFSND